MEQLDQQTLIIVVVVAVAVVLLIIGLVVALRRRSRLKERVEAARRRYGSEFDRTRAATGSDKQALADLEERERRHEDLDLRDLDPDDQQSIRTNLARLQHRFVEDPGEVLARLGTLATQVLQSSGYPVGADRDEALGQLALDHPEKAQPIRRLLTGDYRDDTAQHREVFLAARDAIEGLAHVRAELRDALQEPGGAIASGVADEGRTARAGAGGRHDGDAADRSRTTDGGAARRGDEGDTPERTTATEAEAAEPTDGDEHTVSDRDDRTATDR